MTRWSKAFGEETCGSRGADVARIDAGWERIRARRARPRALRRVAVAVAVAVPVLVLAALLVVVARGFGFGGPGVTVATLAPSAPGSVAPPAPSAPGSVAPAAPLAPIALVSGTPLPPDWTAPAPLAVALDDGSRLELAPATHLRTHRGAPERVELALDRGRTTFDVKPGGPRAWIIDAGSVRVEVLGTRFTVARDGEHVEVSVERGKVKVTDTKGSRILTGGQAFASDGELTPSPSTTASPSPRAAKPALEGLPVVGTESAPKPDLMAQADALRQAGRAAEAVELLRGLVEAGDRRASLAAFTLGKMHAEELRQPALGGRWFERGMALGLPDGLDEEAQARAVECFAKAGAKEEAARAAARYEARFPGGRHLARVREWNGASSR